VVIRPEITAFGPDGTSGSSFAENGTLALDRSAKRLFVVAGGATPGIFGFDVSGPLPPSVLSGFSPLPTIAPNPNPGLAVDNTALSSAGNIYYAPGISGPGRNVYGFDKTGAPLGGNFPIDPSLNPGPSGGLAGDICNTAVDSTGNLWVANYGLARALKYTSAGVFLTSVSSSAQGAYPCNIAFDSNDDLYSGSGSFPTWKYSAVSGYSKATKFDPETSQAIAVDPTNHHVFIAHRVGDVNITEFDENGGVVSRFAMEIPEASPEIPNALFNGLAVDHDQDRLFALDTGNGKVRVFGKGLTYPDLTLGAVSATENSSVVVDGTVSGQGLALSDCHFEYVSDAAFEDSGFSDLSSGGSVPCTPSAGSIPADSATHQVNAALSGLTTDAAYRFRLVAANVNGSIATARAGGFETSGPPLVETTGSPIRAATTARLDGRVDPSRAAATYHFEYGDQGPCDANPCTSTEPHSVGGVDEVQTITVKAAAGQFKLGFGAEITADLPFNSSAAQVESALAALPSIGSGNIAVSGGPGDATGSEPYEVRFTGALAATDAAQLVASDGKTPLSGESSASATTTTPGGPAVKEMQTITVKAVAGQFKLTFGADTAADLPFDASAAEVASALQALPSIGVGNVAVSGGPGSPTGSTPYVVTFEGSLANKNVAQLDVASGAVPLRGDKAASTATTTPGGFGNEFKLVSQQVEGLQPGTTYHYRVVGDNGNPDGPAFGEDMTLTTFANDEPLSHGRLAGPVGNNRAWEMVNAPDTGGNPVKPFFSSLSFSDVGDRAIYEVQGGTPLSETGAFALLFAERTADGWQTRRVYPRREEATESTWLGAGGPTDLSQMVAPNYSPIPTGQFSAWRMTPNAPATEVYGIENGQWGNFIAVSDNDASRVLVTLKGPQDSEHPALPETQNLYDVSSGSPQLISLLPNETVPACGVTGFPGTITVSRLTHWVSADGKLAFFSSKGDTCGGPAELYVRDIEAGTTKMVSASGVSGVTCDSGLIKSTPGAAFFFTRSRLVANDTEPASCSGFGASDGDVYRYDLGTGSLDCVTCVAPSHDADVFAEIGPGIGAQIGVAADGSRLYFTSRSHLLPGAAPTEGAYRVDVKTGDLAYIGHLGIAIGDLDGSDGKSSLSPDGSVVAFRTSDPSLNALGGTQNGGTVQSYRYDDNDHSLVCVSCPTNGGTPRGEVGRLGTATPGVNTGPLDEDGGVFAFATPTPLVPADQNTAGPGQDPRFGFDIYEWREGRTLLISDGLTNWPGDETPSVNGVTPSGRDIFFTAAAQLTQDALDGYARLYDARIGGGFEFPPPPKPCPLEVCQGTPKGAPEEAAPGTASIAGVGNISKSARVACTKPKRKVRRGGKTRCVKPAHRKRAHHNRRTAR